MTMLYIHPVPQHDAADRLSDAFSEGTPEEAGARQAGALGAASETASESLCDQRSYRRYE